MDPVLKLHVSEHRVSQVSRESLVPRDQWVLLDHPAIVGVKDLWAHEGAKAKKVFEDTRVLKGLREHLVKQAHLEVKVKQEAKVPLVPQVPKELKRLLCVTGSSALLRTWMMAGIMAW